MSSVIGASPGEEAGEHFLSAGNPLATSDQRDLEALALRLIETPEVREARGNAAARMRMLAGGGAPDEAWASFDDVLDEWVFHNALKATNLDPNHPRVLRRAFAPPHEWFGMKIPGSRGFGGISPDTTYSIIPIDNNARFELAGQRFEPGPVDVQFSLIGNTALTMTLSNLEWEDLEVEADGSFVITLDPGPGNGARNHIQTGPDARLLFIRDVRADWRQTPNAYRVKRLEPPLTAPLSFPQLAERAARYIAEDTAPVYLFVAMLNVKEINAVEQPFTTGTFGGLVTQMMSVARLRLQDDEAFVVTVGCGGARHHVVPVLNYWACTPDFWRRTCSMNSTQSVPNADGSTTYVVSLQDPGVRNWIDAAGLHEPRLQLRWHALPRDRVLEEGPWIKGALVKLDDLRCTLPAETRLVTAGEREQQLAERLETFRLRSVDR